MTIVEAIDRVVNKRALSEAQARSVMADIMDGKGTSAQIAGLLVALRMKGETTSEIVGFVREMRSRVTPVRTSRPNLVDTCGTGGDAVKTFNISTAAAIIAAGAGATVAKHGNRAVTSVCGSADVLESLGVNLEVDADRASRLLDEIGLAFLFAPRFHPAMKYAAEPRRDLRLRTVFNLLGPLTNPARATRQIVGVFSPNLTMRIARALKRLGAERAVVAHGVVGMDEIAPYGPTKLAVLNGRHLSEQTLTPEDMGASSVDLAAIAPGATPSESAEKLRRAISDPGSPESEASLPSAGAAIWAAGLVDDFTQGTRLAREAVRSGNAAAKLRSLISLSQEPL